MSSLLSGNPAQKLPEAGEILSIRQNVGRISSFSSNSTDIRFLFLWWSLLVHGAWHDWCLHHFMVRERWQYSQAQSLWKWLHLEKGRQDQTPLDHQTPVKMYKHCCWYRHWTRTSTVGNSRKHAATQQHTLDCWIFRLPRWQQSEVVLWRRVAQAPQLHSQGCASLVCSLWSLLRSYP